MELSRERLHAIASLVLLDRLDQGKPKDLKIGSMTDHLRSLQEEASRVFDNDIFNNPALEQFAKDIVGRFIGAGSLMSLPDDEFMKMSYLFTLRYGYSKGWSNGKHDMRRWKDASKRINVPWKELHAFVRHVSVRLLDVNDPNLHDAK